MTCNCHRSPRAARLTPWLLVIAAAAITGCATSGTTPEPAPKQTSGPTPPSEAPPIPERNEIALESGTELVASTPTGKISVIAGPGLLRTIKWDGATRWAVMKPRKERWAGSLGIHYDGTPPDWKPHGGLRRLEFEEGERHFDNLNDAKIWMQIRRMHFVYNSDGLVVGWRRARDEDKLKVEIWQFHIDGKKPSYLPGAKSHLIQKKQKPMRAANKG